MSKNLDIHPTAIVEEGVNLERGCKVGPYAYLQKGAVLGKNCKIESHAVIKNFARIGQGVQVGHFSVIGGDPQHLSFDSTIQSEVLVGDYTRIGEGVTIHRSIEGDGFTRVGEKCFLMGYSHVAHDCQLGDRSVLANGVLLGGHVELGKDVFLGGGSAIHQFIRIGAGAMIGGKAEISLDVAPQLLVSGRNAVSGLNLIGLRRRKYNREDIANLKNAYRSVFKAGNLMLRAQSLLADSEEKEGLIHEFLLFFTEVNRGFARPNTSISDNQ